jgi:hypothetical protein
MLQANRAGTILVDRNGRTGHKKPIAAAIAAVRGWIAQLIPARKSSRQDDKLPTIR